MNEDPRFASQLIKDPTLKMIEYLELDEKDSIALIALVNTTFLLGYVNAMKGNNEEEKR